MKYEFVPGRKWRYLRRFTQLLAMTALFVGPILGGWQRLERSPLSAWKMKGWDLPEWLSDLLPVMQGNDVWDMTKFVGGGGSVDYFALPVSDPVSSTVALFTSGTHLWAVVAWLIPIILAVFLGRIFCGWFCPFGVLARFLDRVTGFVPGKFHMFEAPHRRPVRWAVLFGAIIIGAFGGEWVSYVFLPHGLFQLTIYSMLLLGGLGAVGGAFLGLVSVGLIFGSTIYCDSLCPTGTALGALGRFKPVNVTVVDLESCGSCTLCHRACWLGLDPTDEHPEAKLKVSPGGDCDLCARCFTACPRDNMVIQIGKKAAILLIMVSSISFLAPQMAFAKEAVKAVEHKPDLILSAYKETEKSTIAVAIVDTTGTQYTMDTEVYFGSEISVYVVLGSKLGMKEEGHRAKKGEVYTKNLTVRTFHGGEEDVLVFEKTNAPISTPNRTIYKRKVAYQFSPGDRITVDPVPGIFKEAQTWIIPEVHPAKSGRTAWYFLCALLVAGGLIAMAIGFGVDPEGPKKKNRKRRKKRSKEEEE